MSLVTFFSENDNFMREKRIVPRGKKKFSESEMSSGKVTVLKMWGQPRG
jgi:hypothetical protein